MNPFFNRSKVVISSAVIALTLMVSHASAAIVGNLNIANVLATGLTLSSTGVDFLPPGGGNGPYGTGAGTALATAAGAVVPGETGFLTDFAIGSLPVPSFMNFVAHPGLLLDLTAIGPGVLNTVAVNTFDPNSAPSSPTAGSPYIMQATATGTTITFTVSGIGHDTSSPDSLWSGLFTTQVAGVTPFQIQQALGIGGTVTSTFSASIIGSGVIPEPGIVSMLLLGLIPLARTRRGE